MPLALATCSAMPGLVGDDRHLLAALLARGVDARPVVWEDRYVAWEDFGACVVRSTWDYAYRGREFFAWIDRVAQRCPLYNAADVLRWNAHKGYLVDLVARGVPAVPTTVLAAGSRVALADALESMGLEEGVVKAAIGNSGRFARRVRPGDADGQAALDRILPHEDLLLQPMISAIAEHGELSIVFVDGEPTHAVRKRAQTGDFRVHSDYGGTVALQDPSDAEVDLATRAIEAADGDLLYGRVDLVMDESGPLVMELELVEPELFFRLSEIAVGRMVEGIERRIGR